MSRLPVLDLRRRMASMSAGIGDAVTRVVASGQLLLGEETAAFEAELAAFSGHRHCVAVSSATEALRLALRAMGVGAGDEVIVPAMTAVPTAAAVCAIGATPLFADVDPVTAGLDWNAARDAATRKTRAVVPVHLYGRPVDIEDIGVPVLEDAAQALGATTHPSGSVAAVFSFYPTKNLGGVGDGGAVVTDDTEVAEVIRRLRNHGHAADYRHVDIATNARMSEIEAAVLRVGLPRLADWNERRRQIAAQYRKAAPDVRWHADDDRHTHHLCVVRVEDRDAFRARLPFDTAVHYPLALTQQPAYKAFATTPCPNAEAWAAECVTLPMFPEMTDDEVELVCNALS